MGRFAQTLLSVITAALFTAGCSRSLDTVIVRGKEHQPERTYVRTSTVDYKATYDITRNCVEFEQYVLKVQGVGKDSLEWESIWVDSTHYAKSNKGDTLHLSQMQYDTEKRLDSCEQWP